MNTITAQEIKRSGISAVDTHLAAGAVHVITRNRPSYVVMSEEQYQALIEEARIGVIARVRAAQAEIETGRVERFTDAHDLMAAIDTAEDDDTP